ncbi:hypothetical protein CERSUDRAFT_96200 [Gelatoporia subvermispora B]|uniref:Uncharacterized protein n=1 Tax=Ceriporiopsis subvermispora (strain B) TaxID=914234 RepID=M2QV80_CERS8|nr:hypothetical protein CERSUDRAFT_96200 [Gelatoporia subvermispora B]
MVKETPSSFRLPQRLGDPSETPTQAAARPQKASKVSRPPGIPAPKPVPPPQPSFAPALDYSSSTTTLIGDPVQDGDDLFGQPGPLLTGIKPNAARRGRMIAYVSIPIRKGIGSGLAWPQSRSVAADDPQTDNAAKGGPPKHARRLSMSGATADPAPPRTHGKASAQGKTQVQTSRPLKRKHSLPVAESTVVQTIQHAVSANAALALESSPPRKKASTRKATSRASDHMPSGGISVPLLSHDDQPRRTRATSLSDSLGGSTRASGILERISQKRHSLSQAEIDTHIAEAIQYATSSVAASRNQKSPPPQPMAGPSKPRISEISPPKRPRGRSRKRPSEGHAPDRAVVDSGGQRSGSTDIGRTEAPAQPATPHTPASTPRRRSERGRGQEVVAEFLVPVAEDDGPQTSERRGRSRSRSRRRTSFTSAPIDDPSLLTRKCSAKRCKVFIPSFERYPFKLCDGCRERAREAARRSKLSKTTGRHSLGPAEVQGIGKETEKETQGLSSRLRAASLGRADAAKMKGHADRTQIGSFGSYAGRVLEHDSGGEGRAGRQTEAETEAEVEQVEEDEEFGPQSKEGAPTTPLPSAKWYLDLDSLAWKEVQRSESTPSRAPSTPGSTAPGTTFGASTVQDTDPMDYELAHEETHEGGAIEEQEEDQIDMYQSLDVLCDRLATALKDSPCQYASFEVGGATDQGTRGAPESLGAQFRGACAVIVGQDTRLDETCLRGYMRQLLQRCESLVKLNSPNLRIPTNRISVEIPCACTDGPDKQSCSRRVIMTISETSLPEAMLYLQALVKGIFITVEFLS